MYVPCILSDSALWTWFKSMQMLFGHLKKKSGQATKAHTARQKWTLSNFQYLSAHMCIQTDTSHLSRVPTAALQVDREGEDEGGDDATSVTYSQVPSQLPSTSHASPSQAPCDRRPRAVSSTGTGKRVYDAILKLADHLSQDTGVQDRLQSAVQESAKPDITFCQWMGSEMSKVDKELWTGFMHETFDLVACYRQLQTQQPAPPPPPPPPQAVQQPRVQPQPYQPSVTPILAADESGLAAWPQHRVPASST